LSATSLSSIATPGSTREFTIVPRTGLAAGTYEATVTVSGTGGLVSRSFGVRFTVTPAAANPNLSISPTSRIEFTADAGYTSRPAAQTITVTNTVAGTTTPAVTIALSGSGANAFELSVTAWGSGVVAGTPRTFTVRPVAGVAAGTHNATITVSASGLTSRTVDVRFTVSASSGGSFQTMTAHQVVANMGVGWNLGNTFDAHGDEPNGLFGWTESGLNLRTMTRDTIPGIETAWLPQPNRLQQTTSQSLIRAVKAAGFDTIRIPVTWFKATGQGSPSSSSSFTINTDWMARIKQVVDWAIAENMYVILNTHHEEQVLPLSNSGRDQANRFVTRIWAQIAREFRDYDHRLIFEGLNEPRTKGSANEWWGGTSDERENLNRLNQAFVDTVRADGGNNRWRIVMVPTYAAGGQAGSPVFDGFRIPNDTTNTVNKIILSHLHPAMAVFCRAAARVVSD
jgi:hypothetical protein